MVSRLLIPILMAAAAGGCDYGASSDSLSDSTVFRLKLVKQDEFVLDDPETPVRYLAQLTLLPDGGFVAVDIAADKVRHFDPGGRLLGYIGPPEAAEDEWRPLTSGLGVDSSILWVSDRLGRMWRFEHFGQGLVSQPFTEHNLVVFSVGSSDDLVARRPLEAGELHLYRGGGLVGSFLASDPFNRSLTAKNAPSVTFDPKGNIYAIRFLEPTVFVFNREGREILHWSLQRDPHFREFPAGVDPFSSTRDRNLILAWTRTFTTFPRIEWIGDDRIAVLSANDPPQRPNVLSLYSTQGDHIASAEVEGYLLAAHGRDLYLTNEAYYFEGPCRISRYTIQE